MNDYHIKLAKISEDFTWHKHDDTDEVFIVLDGDMRMDYEESTVTLHENELIVVPKGKLHKPFAEKPASILLIDPAGTLNTGDKQDDYTKEDLEWI
jgi:mannose-6-phosphate isomerase-like protein (cupin superfamily)